MTRSNDPHRLSFAAAMLLALAAGGCAAADRPEEASATARGLWIGPIRLCRDTVAGAETGFDDFGALPARRLVLAPSLQPRLKEATAARVGRTMALRLDGRVLQEPVVNEPITGTALVLTGGSSEEVETMRAATRQTC